MQVKGFKGCLSYVDCCPNQPVPGKAFCAAHCTEAESKQLPTSIREQSGTNLIIIGVTYVLLLTTAASSGVHVESRTSTSAADCQGNNLHDWLLIKINIGFNIIIIGQVQLSS